MKCIQCGCNCFPFAFGGKYCRDCYVSVNSASLVWEYFHDKYTRGNNDV